jgi:hypothetical protein
VVVLRVAKWGVRMAEWWGYMKVGLMVQKMAATMVE